MAGRGPTPKDPNKRARVNKDIIPLRIVEVVPVSRPELPEFTLMVKLDNELVSQEFEWPVMTRDWWDALELHPLKGEFIDADWSYLLDTARLHAAFWMGKLDAAAEIRLREAKYGFTPEDRLRLRIQFAEATGAEIETAKKVESSRSRMQGISKAGT